MGNVNEVNNRPTVFGETRQKGVEQEASLEAEERPFIPLQNDLSAWMNEPGNKV